MKKSILLVAIILLPFSLHSQWKKIANFPNTEYVECVYFLDLPGPPRIGFVGCQTALYKTTDGGKSWTKEWQPGGDWAGYTITDVCFKDTLTGWFSVFNNFGITGDECYRTTDGGGTWGVLNIPDEHYTEGMNIYYCAASNRLFLSTLTKVLISTDLGNTWTDSLPYISPFFSFSTPVEGISPAVFYPDTTWGYIISSNGGETWDTIHPEGGIDNGVLCLSGTQVCFEADGGNQDTIRRSNDFGRTWRVVANLTSDQYGTGIIRGDFSRLTIQTDSGMYVSVDSGVTWQFDGGPTYITNFSNDLFYSAKGVTIAGMTYNDGGDEGGGLWEEIWPTSGVQQAEPSSDTLPVYPNPASAELTVAGAAYDLSSALGAIVIYDPLGREHPVSRNGNTVTTSSLPPGIYFISDGVHRAKFVKE